MIRFECDYGEGAHPRIIERLAETNLEQTVGYGMDHYCDRARMLIRMACDAPEADVHLLVGGTQTNTTVIASVLRPYQGVIAATTGHISIHETGAIESTGHKVLTIPSDDGRITAAQIDELAAAHWDDEDHEHIVQPGMVYISFPTENGTIYSKAELEAIYAVCKKRGLPLFIDGARLGYGLMSPACDLTLPELARLCDVFYVGGTKLGALFGEAVVIMNPDLKRDFRYCIKQHGGMLAKGRLLGLQFEALFRDELYFAMAEKAVAQALRLRAAFEAKGFRMLYDSPTNQQYPIMPDELLAKLAEKYSFCPWRRLPGGESAVRFCTSWATKDADVDALIADIEAL